jgi:ElaB/YqjD/DUF883 family membrane-anchored ribosome-binding protein
MVSNHYNQNRKELIMAEEKIKEALDTLTEAAREKQMRVQELVDQRLGENRTPMQRWMTDRGNAIREAAARAGTSVDFAARKSPWPFVGGAAATGLLVGVLLARSGNGRKPEATQRK